MASSNDGLLYATDFDARSLRDLGFKYSGNKDSQIVERDGDDVVKVTLDHYDSRVATRSEIQPTDLPASDFDKGMFAEMGQEYWYGVKMFLDKGWEQRDTADTVLMQFHSQPDKGEAWRNPPVALQIVDKDGEAHWNLVVRSDDEKITKGKSYDSVEQYDLGAAKDDVGHWIDLAWNVKWNYDGSGFLKLYKDGELVADIDGANTFNDATGPYLKMGLYKYDWASSKDTGPNEKSLYLDDFRVGDAHDAGSFLHHDGGLAAGLDLSVG